MKTINKKEMEQLHRKLDELKSRKPRKYKRLEFHLNDFGTGVMLGMAVPNNGFHNVTRFLSYESMYILLNYMAHPIDKEMDNILSLMKHKNEEE